MIWNLSSTSLIIDLLIVLIILVIVAVVMLSPILFTVHLKKDEGQQSNEFSITLWILFIPVSFKNRRKSSRDTKRIESIIKKNATKTSGKYIKKRMGQGKLLVPLIRRFIASIIGKIAISEMKFHLLFGLDDPADTGIAYGLLSSVMHPLKARYPVSDIQISPSFAEPVCEYDIAGTARLRMFNLLYAALYTFISRDMYVLIRSNVWKS